MAPALPRGQCHVINPPSRIQGLRRRSLQTVAGSADPSLAFDGEPYTHWIAEFDATAARADKPILNLQFDVPATVTHYTIMSGNAHPQQDPSSWVIYCRRHDDPDGDWQLIDTKTDELWESRHETRTFQMTPVANIYPACDEISIVVTDLRDAQYQGGAGVGLDGTITTDLQQQTFTPKMQLAEVALFNDAAVLNPNFVTEVTEIRDESGVPVFTFIGAKIMIFVLSTRNCVSRSHKNEELRIKITQKRGSLY